MSVLPTLLLADDDDDDFMLVERAVSELECRPPLARAKDGAQALQELKRRRAARERVVLLLDLNMPRMSGRETLARIRADPALRTVPVVVLTSSSAPAEVAAAYDAGASSFLRKPLEYASLVELMRALIGYWAESAELP